MDYNTNGVNPPDYKGGGVSEVGGKVGVEFRLHWLTFSVFMPLAAWLPEWDRFFSVAFGPLVETGRSRFFNVRMQATLGVSVMGEPIEVSGRGEFVTVNIPGGACDAIRPVVVNRLFESLLARGIEFQVTRADLAFDGVDFTPGELYGYLVDHAKDRDCFRSLVKRDKIKYFEAAMEVNDLGELGTSGLQVGSGSSQRCMRVYDKRGFTRLEVQFREERAHLVYLDVFLRSVDRWGAAGLAHLLDYVWVALDGFLKLVHGQVRAGLSLLSSRKVTAEKLRAWLEKQVAPALSTMQDLESGFVLRLLAAGRLRDRRRYAVLLEGVNYAHG